MYAARYRLRCTESRLGSVDISASDSVRYVRALAASSMASNFNFPEGSELKTAFSLGALLSLMFLFTGCFMGELSGRSGENFTPPKPYMSYWHKDGMIEEGRRADWVACGGDADGGFSMHVKRMLPGETNETSRLRQTSEFKACLAQRGYRYEVTRD